MQNKSYKKLIHRISRLEGQLASIRRELEREAPDCAKASNTLSAASRSFASLRRAFIECFLDHYLKRASQSKALRLNFESLMRIVSS